MEKIKPLNHFHSS